MSNHLFALVRGALPAEPAARTFIETAEGCRYSYADLMARSAAYSAALTAMGVRPGDRVLEPSAGTGLLAILAEQQAAQQDLAEQPGAGR